MPPSCAVLVPRPRQRARRAAPTARGGGSAPCRARRRSGSAASPTSSPKRGAVPSGSAAPIPQPGGRARREVRVAPRARRGSSGRPSRCRCRPCARPGRARAPNERDRDDHRVALPTLPNCCGPRAVGTRTRDDQLVGAERGAPAPMRSRATGISRGRRAAEATSTVAPRGQERRERVAGGRGRAEVAAERAAGADLRRADGARGHAQAGQLGRRARAMTAQVRHARAEPTAPSPALPVLQLGHAGQVERRARAARGRS